MTLQTPQDPQDPFATPSQVLAPPRRRPRIWLVALLSVPLGVILIAAGVLVPRMLSDTSTPASAEGADAVTSFAPQPFGIRGFLTLKLGQFAWISSTDFCTGYKGYDDIRAGTQVVITDPAKKTIAIGQLEAGIPRHDPDDNSKVLECRFPIKVSGVPGEHPFYGIEIARRGKLDYERDRIDKPLELTLG